MSSQHPPYGAPLPPPPRRGGGQLQGSDPSALPSGWLRPKGYDIPIDPDDTAGDTAGDTDEDKVVIKKGVSGRLVLILMLLLLLGGAAFVWLGYLPTLEKLADAESNAAFLAGEAERAATLQEERDALELERERLAAQVAVLTGERDQLRARTEETAAALAELQAAKDALEAQLGSEIASGDVSVRTGGGQLGIDVADRVLFQSGSAELSPRGQAVLTRVAETLRTLEDKMILVAGHTDANPVSQSLTDRFATNWELSTARATHVVRFLQDEAQVPGERLVAQGFSAYRPVANNRSARGRQRNRRIEINLAPLPGPR
jgi:chemotaxis protein MotB